jgi:phosphonate transport system substrate-binding protein
MREEVVMKSVRALWLLALAVALMLPTGSAVAKDASWPAEITFALLSTESAPEITRRWGPILAQLEKDLGIRVKHTTATDYRGTIEALKFKKAEMGWLGPKAYIEASTNNYANVEPVAQVRNQNGSLGYRSCLITHPDSDIFGPEDLAGKSFAFNDPNSTSGYLVPMTFFLNELGVDVKRHFAKVMFSGSHEASILAVANKKVDVASTNLPDMQQLTREGKVARGGLRVIWVSKLIPNDPVVVRKDLPPSLKTAIEESLVSMKERAPEAFANAGAFFGGGFVPADDAKYQIVREMNDAAKRLAAQK